MTSPTESSGNEGDIERVSGEIANRLTSRGIRVLPSDRPEHLADMLDAVEEFEEAVERHGGDLMVDESSRGEAKEPDDRHFALPVRRDHESAAQYVERLARATDDVRRHPPRAD